MELHSEGNLSVTSIMMTFTKILKKKSWESLDPQNDHSTDPPSPTQTARSVQTRLRPDGPDLCPNLTGKGRISDLKLLF